MALTGRVNREWQVANEMKKLKKRLVRRFERAIPAYDEAAVVQAEMAERLLSRLKPLLDEKQIRTPRVLEIGAGTGLPTRQAIKILAPTFYLASDLVPACGKCLRGLPVSFVAGDGENPSWIKGPFDLIISNATFQWFLDLAGALKKVSCPPCLGGNTCFYYLRPGDHERGVFRHERP
jgi:malonyl-CoA O-methyltransferase